MKRALLKFRSPLLAEQIRSDTLFGAICWGYRLLFGEGALQSLLDDFKSGRAPFTISSCFPYIEVGDKREYLYPKPLAFDPTGSTLTPAGEEDTGKIADENSDPMKNFKKMKYVSEGLFKKMCSSGEIENVRSCTFHKRNFTSFMMDGEEYVVDDEGVALERGVAERLVEERRRRYNRGTLRIFSKYEKPGVSVDRLTISPGETLHFRSEYYIAPDAGLHILIDGDSKVLSKVEAVLRFLADRGIGGKISCGRGAFEFKGMEDANLEKPKDAFVTLSLYLPKQDELSAFNENNTWYELAVRKGMVECSFIKVENQWKDKLLMFAEGSVFPAQGSEPYGRCEVVKHEPFEVLHYGLAFPVNFRRNRDA